MKRAFTLIELLVVIAIIAILAAILFPVFTQAKLAAKKTAVLSNVKQISTGMFLYQANNDDYFFKGRYCAPNSALNPKFRDASYNSTPTSGCTSGTNVYNIVDERFWQKFLMPYEKSVDIFMNQLRAKDAVSWNTYGQIWGQTAFNIGITGLLSVNLTTGNPFSYSNIASFSGGNQGGLVNPSATLLFVDNVPLNTSPYVPALVQVPTGGTSTSELTGYPRADREFWQFRMTKMTQAECAMSPQPIREADASKIVAGGVNVGKADGSAKFFTTGAFLGATPPTNELLTGGTVSSDTCYVGDPLFAGDKYTGTINTNINYPLWGFGN